MDDVEVDKEALDAAMATAVAVAAAAAASPASTPTSTKDDMEVDAVPHDVSEAQRRARLDKVRALFEARQASERSLCVFEGALKFLAEQEAWTRVMGACGVCRRVLRTRPLSPSNSTSSAPSAGDGGESERDRGGSPPLSSPVSATDDAAVTECAGRIRTRQAALERARDHADLLSIHQECMRQIAMLDMERAASFKVCESRVMYSIRSGALLELRTQKQDVLALGRCFACLHPVRGNEVERFLAATDKRAAEMERSLHVVQCDP